MSGKRYSSKEMDRYFNDPEYRRNKGMSGRGKTNNKKPGRNIILGFVILLSGLFIYFIIHVFSGLPSLAQLENPRPELASKVYSIDGELVDRYFIINRSSVTLDEVPRELLYAIITTEDRKFFNHWGIDLDRIIKQVIINIRSMEVRGGASTISQQVARNLYLTQELSILRKLREAITAVQIERTYTKYEILEMYLNIAYFGRGTFGIASAAQMYFGKIPGELTLEECAILVQLLPNPAIYDPFNWSERAITRRNRVLSSMLQLKFISEKEYAEAVDQPLQLRDRDVIAGSSIAPHFVELVRRQLASLSEQYGFDIYRDGLKIYTTLDSRMQKHANRAVDEHLERYQDIFDEKWDWDHSKHRNTLEIALNRHIRETDQYRRAARETERDSIRHLLLEDSTFVNSVKRATKRIQVGFVALDHGNGHIRAMVGGSDYREVRHGLNRATQIRRQSGSAFKPFVFTVALDNGYSPSYELLNQPVVLHVAEGRQWRPSNADGSFGGRNTIREGLKRSINLIAVRAIMEIAPIQKVVEYAKRMGIHSHIPPYPSISLGTSLLSPLEITSAYGVFANEGVYVEPIAILRIEDRDGNVITEFSSDKREVLSRETAYLMTDMLEDVIRSGTGIGVRNFFHFPAAGKTGTTQDFADAWFIGYTPHLTAGTWVGFDDRRITFTDWDGQGSRAALPIWGRFMSYTYNDREINLPVKYFRKPETIVEEIICNETKMAATEYCPSRSSELFLSRNVPNTCDLHTTLRWDEERTRRGAVSY